MKRVLLSLVLILALPAMARAQYQHANFFNGGTTLTATCTNTTGTIVSSDAFLGTLQGNTTVTLPAAAIGCIDFAIVDLRPTQAANHTYTLTVNAGAGTALQTPTTILAVPAAGAGVTTNGLHQIWAYNATTTTPQWELVTQLTIPPTAIPATAGGTGATSMPTGALKGDGTKISGQAACADLSNGAASCSTDTTNATNITSGNLPFAVNSKFVQAMTVAHAMAFNGGL